MITPTLLECSGTNEYLLCCLLYVFVSLCSLYRVCVYNVCVEACEWIIMNEWINGNETVFKSVLLALSVELFRS